MWAAVDMMGGGGGGFEDMARRGKINFSILMKVSKKLKIDDAWTSKGAIRLVRDR